MDSCLFMMLALLLSTLYWNEFEDRDSRNKPKNIRKMDTIWTYFCCNEKSEERITWDFFSKLFNLLILAAICECIDMTVKKKKDHIFKSCVPKVRDSPALVYETAKHNDLDSHTVDCTMLLVSAFNRWNHGRTDIAKSLGDQSLFLRRIKGADITKKLNDETTKYNDEDKISKVSATVRPSTVTEEDERNHKFDLYDSLTGKYDSCKQEGEFDGNFLPDYDARNGYRVDMIDSNCCIHGVDIEEMDIEEVNSGIRSDQIPTQQISACNSHQEKIADLHVFKDVLNKDNGNDCRIGHTERTCSNGSLPMSEKITHSELEHLEETDEEETEAKEPITFGNTRPAYSRFCHPSENNNDELLILSSVRYCERSVIFENEDSVKENADIHVHVAQESLTPWSEKAEDDLLMTSSDLLAKDSKLQMLPESYSDSSQVSSASEHIFAENTMDFCATQQCIDQNENLEMAKETETCYSERNLSSSTGISNAMLVGDALDGVVQTEENINVTDTAKEEEYVSKNSSHAKEISHNEDVESCLPTSLQSDIEIMKQEPKVKIWLPGEILFKEPKVEKVDTESTQQKSSFATEQENLYGSIRKSSFETYHKEDGRYGSFYTSSCNFEDTMHSKDPTVICVYHCQIDHKQCTQECVKPEVQQKQELIKNSILTLNRSSQETRNNSEREYYPQSSKSFIKFSICNSSNSSRPRKRRERHIRRGMKQYFERSRRRRLGWLWRIMQQVFNMGIVFPLRPDTGQHKNQTSLNGDIDESDNIDTSNTSQTVRDNARPLINVTPQIPSYPETRSDGVQYNGRHESFSSSSQSTESEATTNNSSSSTDTTVFSSSIGASTLDSFFSDFSSGSFTNIEQQMHNEWIRITSFGNFPLTSAMSTTRLAREGWYYVGPNDRTKCFSCSATHENWHRGEDPRMYHSASCSFIAGTSNNMAIYSSHTPSLPGLPSVPLLGSNLSQMSIPQQEPPATNLTEQQRSVVAQTSSGTEGLIPAMEQVFSHPSHQLSQQIQHPQDDALPNSSSQAIPTTSSSQYAPSVSAPPTSGILYMTALQNAREVNPNIDQEVPQARQAAAAASVSNMDRSVHNTSQSATDDTSHPPRPEDYKPDPLGINFDRPRYPAYAVQSVRISSFQGWPSANTQTAREMAIAGFYYAGYGDYVRCFFCGGGLRNWEPGDDPWVEHARWFPKCAFVKHNRGEKFIQLVLKRAAEVASEQRRETPAGSTSGNTSASSADREMQSPAIQSIKEMGYAEPDIRKALTMLKQRLGPGKHRVTAQDILEILFSIADNPSNSTSATPARTETTTANAQSQGPVAAPSASQNTEASTVSKPETSTSQSKEENLKSGEGNQPSIGGSSNSSQDPTNMTAEELRSLQAENNQLKEQIICKICMDKNVEVAFLPCGHLACCRDCAPAMRKCPICREFVKGTVKTYLV